MDTLIKCDVRSFYVENNILYINDNGNNIEVEMVRKTPRYEVRYNGKLVSDSETSQNDILDKIFKNILSIIVNLRRFIFKAYIISLLT